MFRESELWRNKDNNWLLKHLSYRWNLDNSEYD